MRGAFALGTTGQGGRVCFHLAFSGLSRCLEGPLRGTCKSHKTLIMTGSIFEEQITDDNKMRGVEQSMVEEILYIESQIEENEEGETTTGCSANCLPKR